MIARAGLAMALMSGAAIAQTVQPGDFNGDWTAGDPSACVLFRDSENFAMRIENGVMQGLESSCDMRDPVPVRGMGALLFDMSCGGEGETWTYRALFMQDGPDHLILVQDGLAQTLSRCLNTQPSGAGTPSK